VNSAACHSLIEDIVYHAVKDLETLDRNPTRVYVDDDHRAMCNSQGFGDGRAELVQFFQSPWFSRICDEFESITEEDILSHVDIEST
jgi:hypothetical protein